MKSMRFPDLILTLSITDFLSLKSDCIQHFWNALLVEKPSRMWIGFNGFLIKFEVLVWKLHLGFSYWIIPKRHSNHLVSFCGWMPKFQAETSYMFNMNVLVTQYAKYWHWLLPWSSIFYVPTVVFSDFLLSCIKAA